MRIFLLSPANMRGIRARQLCSPRAKFAAARLLRSPAGVPIGQAFLFTSGLYFRGKLAYATRFAVPPATSAGVGIYVIAPGFGLVSPDWALDAEKIKRLQRTPVDPKSRAYRKPLEKHAEALAATLDGSVEVVLLGSIATGKYLDPLRPIFGDRLLFPRCFVGLGDMSRGALLLRAAACGEELEYASIQYLGERLGKN